MIPKSIQFENELKNKIDKNVSSLRNIDLNTITETGFYYCLGSCTNLPVDNLSVYLTVIPREGGNYIYQQAIVVDTTRMYTYERQLYGGGSNWTGWLPIMVQYNIPINTDFDSILKTGIYWFNGSVPTGNNRPSNITGFLEVFTFGALTTQRYTEYTGNRIYQRGYFNGNWSDWKEIAIPSIGIIEGTDDFNNYKTEGRYKYGGLTTVSNRPSVWGLVEVITCLNYITQRVSGANGAQFRFSSDSGATWSAWRNM